MDVLAHGLWTNAVFYQKYARERTQRFLAVLFGILPDLVSFTPSTIYLLFHRQDFYSITTELGRAHGVFKYAIESYNYTHSIIIFSVVMLIVVALRKGRIYWPMWGWALHIFIDIFSHKNFFATPFLFPISDFRVKAISWAHPVFMAVNYSALAAVYLVWFLVIRKRHEPTNSHTNDAKR